MAQTPEDLLDKFIEATAQALISHCQEQGCSLELGIKDWQDEMPEIQEKLTERVLDQANFFIDCYLLDFQSRFSHRLWSKRDDH